MERLFTRGAIVRYKVIAIFEPNPPTIKNSEYMEVLHV